MRTMKTLLAASALLLATGNLAQAGLFGLGGDGVVGGFTWTDVANYQGWRVEKSAIIGHYRLVDDRGRRQTFGSLDHCLTELARYKREKNLPPLPKDVVIVAHGLGANRAWMKSLCHYLETEGGMHVVNFGYASTMDDIGAHAGALASVIDNLEGVETISFVCHSMGNIVVRHYLKDIQQLPEDQRPPVKFKRMVMISPPNHGASMADNFADFIPAEMLAGPAIEQLAPGKGWADLEKELAVPDFEFGIIVGGRGDGKGYLHAISGDDDGLLSIETQRLAGASDYVQIVKGIHQMMPKYKQVQEYALRFLQKGYFLTPEARQPIGKPVAP